MDNAIGDGSGSPSYYAMLGVNSDASTEDIKKSYRKLAMEWHPDRWVRRPSMLAYSKRRFQEIQEAYSVLSDKRKRELYDMGLYDPDEDEEEGFSDFMCEMLSLMKQNNKEGGNCSLKDLQVMFAEMVQDFDLHHEWMATPFGSSDSPKRVKRDSQQNDGSYSFFSERDALRSLWR